MQLSRGFESSVCGSFGPMMRTQVERTDHPLQRSLVVVIAGIRRDPVALRRASYRLPSVVNRSGVASLQRVREVADPKCR
jgi:hypothetical protein